MRLLLALALWVAGSASGLAYLATYAAAPGPACWSPATWPPGSRVPREDGLMTLVVFLHPRCPCSEATMGELERALVRKSRPVRLCFVFYRPAGTDDRWGDSSLRRRAGEMEPSSIIDDDDGCEARLFGAGTSGSVVLYDAVGSLVYRGGVTASRGHEGDNAGRSSLAALLSGGAPEVSAAPVYGCPLCGSGGSSCDSAGARDEEKP